MLKRLSDVIYSVLLIKQNRVVILHRDCLAPHQPLRQSREESGFLLQSQVPDLVSEMAGGPVRPTQRQHRLPQPVRNFVMDTYVAGDSEPVVRVGGGLCGVLGAAGCLPSCLGSMCCQLKHKTVYLH